MSRINDAISKTANSIRYENLTSENFLNVLEENICTGITMGFKICQKDFIKILSSYEQVTHLSTLHLFELIKKEVSLMDEENFMGAQLLKDKKNGKKRTNEK